MFFCIPYSLLINLTCCLFFPKSFHTATFFSPKVFQKCEPILLALLGFCTLIKKLTLINSLDKFPNSQLFKRSQIWTCCGLTCLWKQHNTLLFSSWIVPSQDELQLSWCLAKHWTPQTLFFPFFLKMQSSVYNRVQWLCSNGVKVNSAVCVIVHLSNYSTGKEKWTLVCMLVHY